MSIQLHQFGVGLESPSLYKTMSFKNSDVSFRCHFYFSTHFDCHDGFAYLGIVQDPGALLYDHWRSIRCPKISGKYEVSTMFDQCPCQENVRKPWKTSCRTASKPVHFDGFRPLHPTYWNVAWLWRYLAFPRWGLEDETRPASWQYNHRMVHGVSFGVNGGNEDLIGI